MTLSVAMIGGRGYAGAEFLRLLMTHPELELAFASSTSQAGSPLQSVCPEWPDGSARFLALEPEAVAAHAADAWVLAVPNGAAAAWATAIDKAHPGSAIIDLSADYRFDADWVYGLPERFRSRLQGARRIANPGCYATGIQLSLLPLLEQLDGVPVVFGVSGYSGAGKSPSPKNDPERLRDNLMPYSLAGHMHEREASHQLAREIRFMPHVAEFFRGISLTISARLARPTDADTLHALFDSYYANEPRVRVTETAPEVAAVRNTPDVLLGGFTVDPRDPRRICLVAVLDNLLKGAASQAMQNLNLALGLDESLGVMHE